MKQLNYTLITSAILISLSAAWAADRGTTTQPQLAPMTTRPAPTATPVPIPAPRYMAPVPRPASDATPVPIPSPVRAAPPPRTAPLARPQPRPVYREPRRMPPPVAPMPGSRNIPQPVMRDPRQMDPRQFRPDYPYYPDMQGRGAPGMGMPQGYGYGQERGGAFGGPGNPYGSFDPRQGQSGGTMAGDSQGGMPGGIALPQGTFNPSDQIMGAEEVPQYGRGTSMGDYSGGIIPGKNPKGGLQGTQLDETRNILLQDMNDGVWGDMSVTELDGKNGGTELKASWEDGSYVLFTFDKNGRGTGSRSFTPPPSGGSSQSEDGGNDTGKKPWGPNQQKMYQRAQSKAFLDQLLNDTAVNSEGGLPIDRDKQAQGDGTGSPQGDKSQTGQAPQAANQAIGSKPGAGLVGPTDDITGKAPIKEQLVLPKGFHVVDPAARNAVSESNLDEEMGAVPSAVK